MLWLDSVLAVPTIGIRLKRSYRNILEIDQKIFSFLDDLPFPCQKIDRKEIWGYHIYADDFRFIITVDNIVFQFAYKITDRKKAGDFPSLENPELRRYSEIFDKIIDFLDLFLEDISGLSGIFYDRIGIVADADLNEDSLPPGGKDFIKYIGRPWNNKLDSMKLALLSKFEENEIYEDRCFNNFSFNEKMIEEDGFKLILDWQRVYREAQPFRFTDMKNNISSCREKAFDYFEKFGAGDLSYE